MTRVSATELRSNLFDYLARAAAGETIVIQRNRREVARLIPAQPVDWREKMHLTPHLLVPPAELTKPLAEIWVEYT